MKEPPNRPYDRVKRVGMLMQIPLILGLSPIVGCAIGWGIDKFFKTSPIFTLLLLLIGFIAGFRETWNLIKRSSDKS